MSFSASTCITNIGSANLGPTLKIYKNPISPTNNGVYVQDVSTSLITGANCPYTYLLDDDATSVRIFDPSSYCYVDFTVTEGGACVFCDLSLSNVSNNLIGIINVGNLTGSCDPTITDYKIAWYGPDSSTNLSFTSGKGTSFPGYSATHPLTGTSAPFVLPGNYVSRITDVELNGVKYSVTGGTGTGSVLSSGLTACSATFNVSAFTCNNGTYDGPYYEHEKEFVTDGSGTLPQTLQTAFKLSANTDYFIWDFYGYNIYDTLTLTFSGSSYTVPLVLEDIRVGGGASFNILPTTWPKKYSGQSFKKITNLTGLTVNEGDLIIIQITPNPDQNATSWKLKFGCYDEPTAEKNCLDSYKNQSYKIKQSPIYVSTPSCGQFYIDLQYSGCTSNENTGFTQSDLINLSDNSFDFQPTYLSTDNTTKLLSRRFYFNDSVSGITQNGLYYTTVCMFTTGNVIKITKTVGQIEFFFSNLSDLAGYYTNFNITKNAITNYIPSSSGGSTLSSDNTNYNYFRRIWLLIPNSAVSSSSVCDTPGVAFSTHYIHPSSTATSGNTSGGYTMTITLHQMPSPNNFVCPSCWECSTTTYITDDVNTFYNLTFSERTYTNGLRYSNPFYYAVAAQIYTNPPSYVSNVGGGWNFNYDYSLKTYPASGSTNTLIPSLSATTWDWENHSVYTDNGSYGVYKQTVYQTKIEITATSPTIQYKIYSQQISNFLALSPWIEIYDSTNPTYFDSNYMF